MVKSIHRPEYLVLLQKVRQMRLAAGLTQAALSEKLGRDQTHISNIERGVRRLDVLELRDLCRLLGQDFLGFMQELERSLPSRPKRKQ